MIPLREAQEFVLDACPPLDPRPIPIDQALGCVVGDTIVATEPVPPFVNSARDGYALRAGDTVAAGGGSGPVRLQVVALIMAGSSFDGLVGPGQAARIMTGAPLPAGADAICMLEDCEVEENGAVVVIQQPVAEGEAVRRIGEDVALGDVVADPGRVLTPGHIGVLANQGMADVLVHPRPRIGILSTGDELVSGSGPLGPGQIRDANRHTLLALVRREGWAALDLGKVGDDEEALSAVLDQAAISCDAVVTSGGVSVGDHDIVKVVLEKRSAGTMRWMQVAIRPAKPFAFGTLDGSGTPVFGLPGNPVSAMVSFELFVRPAVRQMGGHRRLDRVVVPAVAQADLRRRPDGKTHFVRAMVSLDAQGGWAVAPMAGQNSHQLRAMADANALVVLPDGAGVTAGHPVDVLLIDPEGLSADPREPSDRRW
ncbi:MAG TPA: gephyrin-like molybdotransferase Glp [Acidimicrobiales bacterium]|jgi:molybdenum cofactor synthesis domain-containing protein|nr:gephyrin-like molybdotransferase Glp [Acidimicrobiales bacterium]